MTPRPSAIRWSHRSAGGTLVAAAALLLSPGSAAAAVQAADTLPSPDSAVRLQEVRVTVARSEGLLAELPLAATVVTKPEDAAEGRHASVEEELRGVPGVFVQNRRNYSLGDRLLIRGTGARAQFGVRGIQVLADGVPLTLPDGQVTLSNVPLASVERVEVIRGAAAALYGNAAGGVIRFHSRDPGEEAGGVVGLQGGSHGFLRGRVGTSGRLGDTGYALDAVHLRTDGFRRHASATVTRGNLTTRTELGPDTELRGVLNLYDTPFAENPSSLDAETARERPASTRELVLEQGLGEEATQLQGGLTLRHAPGPGAGVSATLWGLARDVWNPIPFRVIDLDREAAGLRSEASGRTALGDLPLRWSAGLDAAVQRDDRRERANEGVPETGGRTREGERLVDQAESVSSVGPFARAVLVPDDRWRLTLAGRWDGYRFSADDRLPADGDDGGERTMEHLSPFVGVAFLPAGGTTLYANYSGSFETPTTSELSNRPEGGGGFNPDLGPATHRTVEVGGRAELAGGGLSVDVALFRTRVEDALVPFEGESEEVFFRNAGEVDRRGLEASISARPAPSLLLRLTYDLRDHRFESFPAAGLEDPAGNREPAVPPHRVYAGMSYRTPFGLRAELDLRWVDAYPVDDANRAWNPSSRRVDLRLTGDLPLAGTTARPVLEVENLLDERYNASVVPNAFGGRYYEPAPGRSVFGGLSLRF